MTADHDERPDKSEGGDDDEPAKDEIHAARGDDSVDDEGSRVEEARAPATRRRRRAVAEREPRPSSKRGSGGGRALVVESFDALRRRMALAGAALLAGIALCATGDATFGPWVVVAALVACLAFAHRIGRTGPDAGVFGRRPRPPR